MRNPSLARNRGFIQLWPRRVIRTLLGIGLLLVAALSILYFRQHSMVYHPRPYHESYAYAFPANGVEINYTVATAKYFAYYIPATAPFPKRLWIAFCGNGSLALDWTTILREYWAHYDAFLLIDYPGYGKNGGYATIASTRASTDAALKALCERLKLSEEQLTLCTIGHSLGAAVALDFSTHHRVQNVVLISPFTPPRGEPAPQLGASIPPSFIQSHSNTAN